MKKTIITIILLTFSIIGYSQFKNATFLYKGFTLPYQLMLPEGYDESKSYPLLIFLHGAGERGNDNQKQLTHGKEFLIGNFQAKYPAIVIAPQCPSDSYWANVVRHQIDNKLTFSYSLTDEPTKPMEALMALIGNWMSSGKVDINKMYVGGLSMGGMGTLELLWRMPNTFAAAFPICGGMDTGKLPLFAKNTAVWLFHGDADMTVPAEYSRTVYKTLKELGGEVEYTEYKGVGHNSWDYAFKEEGLASWLFSFKRQ